MMGDVSVEWPVTTLSIAEVVPRLSAQRLDNVLQACQAVPCETEDAMHTAFLEAAHRRGEHMHNHTPEGWVEQQLYPQPHFEEAAMSPHSHMNVVQQRSADPAASGWFVSTVPQNVAGTRLALMHVEQRMAAQLRMSRIPHLAVAVSTPIRYAESLHRVRPLPPLVDSALQGEARKSNLLATQLLLAGFHNTEAAASFVHLGRDGMFHVLLPSLKAAAEVRAAGHTSAFFTSVDCAVFAVADIILTAFPPHCVGPEQAELLLSLLVHSKVCAPEPLKDPPKKRSQAGREQGSEGEGGAEEGEEEKEEGEEGKEEEDAMDVSDVLPKVWAAVAQRAHTICAPLLLPQSVLCDTQSLQEAVARNAPFFLSRLQTLLGVDMGVGSALAAPYSIIATPAVAHSFGKCAAQLQIICQSFVIEQKAALLRNNSPRDFVRTILECLETRVPLYSGADNLDCARLLALLEGALKDHRINRVPPGLKGILDRIGAYASPYLFAPTPAVLRLLAECSGGKERLRNLKFVEEFYLKVQGERDNQQHLTLVKGSQALVEAALSAAYKMTGEQACKHMAAARFHHRGARTNEALLSDPGQYRIMMAAIECALEFWEGRVATMPAPFCPPRTTLLGKGFVDTYDFAHYSSAKMEQHFCTCIGKITATLEEAERLKEIPAGLSKPCRNVGLMAHYSALSKSPVPSVLCILKFTLELCRKRLSVQQSASGVLLMRAAPLARCLHLLAAPYEAKVVLCVSRVQRAVRCWRARRQRHAKVAQWQAVLVSQVGVLSTQTTSRFLSGQRGSQISALQLLYESSTGSAACALAKCKQAHTGTVFCSTIVAAFARSKLCVLQTRDHAFRMHAAAARIQKCGRALQQRLHIAEALMRLRLASAVGVVQRTLRRHNAHLIYNTKILERNSRHILHRVGRGYHGRATFMAFSQQLFFAEETCLRGAVDTERADASADLKATQQQMFAKTRRRLAHAEFEERVRIEEGIRTSLRTDIAAYHQYNVKVITIRTHFPPLNAEEKLARSRTLKLEHKARRELTRLYAQYYANIGKRHLQCLVVASLAGDQNSFSNIRTLAVSEGYTLGATPLSPAGKTLQADGTEAASETRTPLLSAMCSEPKAASPMLAMKIMVHAEDKELEGVEKEVLGLRHAAAKQKTHSLRRKLDRSIRTEVFKAYDDDDASVSSPQHDQWAVGDDGDVAFKGNLRRRATESQILRPPPQVAPMKEAESALLATWAPDPTTSPGYRELGTEVLHDVAGKQTHFLSNAVADMSLTIDRSVQEMWQGVGGRSATRIQALYRGYALRKRYNYKDAYAARRAGQERDLAAVDHNLAARSIQKRVRGVLARKYVAWFVLQRPVARGVMQRMGRGLVSRVRTGCHKVDVWMRVRTIEAWWLSRQRIIAAKQVLCEMREQRMLFLMQQESATRKRRWNASVLIQRYYRAVCRRRRLIHAEKILLNLQRFHLLDPCEMFLYKQSEYILDARRLQKQDKHAARLHCPRKVNLVVTPLQRMHRQQSHLQKARKHILNVKRAKLSLPRACVRLQRFWKGVLTRRLVQRYRSAILTSCARIKCIKRGHDARMHCAQQRAVIRNKAATKIQGAFIGWTHRRRQGNAMVRKRVERRMVLREAAAVTLQAVYRGYTARSAYRAERSFQQDKKHLIRVGCSCRIVQRFLRGCLARSKLRRLHRAAKSIQTFYRFQLRHRLFVKKRLVQQSAARRIQRTARNSSTRKTIRKLRKAREAAYVRRDEEERCEDAVTHIQKAWRGHKGRGAAVVRKEAVHTDLLNTNALSIQTCWRRHRAQDEVSRTRAAKTTSAICIQSLWKGQKQRRAYQDHVRMMSMKTEAAALRLQRFQRVVVARARFKRVRLEHRLRLNELLIHTSTHNLQRIGRAMRARREAKRSHVFLSINAIKVQRVWVGHIIRFMTRPLLSLRKTSAFKIQRVWKGYLVRKVVVPLMRARRKRSTRVAVWEADVWQLFTDECLYIKQAEMTHRREVNSSADDGHVALLQQREEHRVAMLQLSQRRKQRHEFTRLREGIERTEMGEIDAVALQQWRREFMAREAQRKEVLQRVVDRSYEEYTQILADETEARELILSQSNDLYRDACLKEWRRLWVNEQDKVTEEAQRKTQIKEAHLSPEQLLLKRRQEQYNAERKLSEELTCMERTRRHQLDSTEKCNEFRMSYFSRRLDEMRKPGADKAAKRRPPANEAPHDTNFVPLNGTYPATKGRAASNPLLSTYGGREQKKLAELDSVVASAVPLRPFASEWIVRRREEESAALQQTGYSAPPALTMGSKKPHFVPGSRSAKGRVQCVLPALAADDPSVVEVDLSGAALTDVHLHSLLSALKNNTSCKTLKLDENEVNDTMAKQIAEVLCTQQSVSFLSLRSNRLTDAGVQALVPAVKQNRNLRRIDVGGNIRATAAGCNALESALTVNARFTASVPFPHCLGRRVSIPVQNAL